MPSLAIACYRAHAGHEDALAALVAEHYATLAAADLVTDQPSLVSRAADGTYVEVFVWRDDAAKSAAHEHPAVQDLWGRMAACADFPGLASLGEAQGPFADFALA